MSPSTGYSGRELTLHLARRNWVSVWARDRMVPLPLRPFPAALWASFHSHGLCHAPSHHRAFAHTVPLNELFFCPFSASLTSSLPQVSAQRSPARSGSPCPGQVVLGGSRSLIYNTCNNWDSALFCVPALLTRTSPPLKQCWSLA